MASASALKHPAARWAPLALVAVVAAAMAVHGPIAQPDGYHEFADTHETPHAIALNLALAVIGIASVLWWFFTGRTGIGDLRPYLLLQVAPLLLVPAWQALAGSPRHERIAFGFVIALYAAAKAAELGDRTLFEALGFLSGHTAKHLLASLASLVLVMSIVAKSRADAGARA